MEGGGEGECVYGEEEQRSRALVAQRGAAVGERAAHDGAEDAEAAAALELLEQREQLRVRQLVPAM